MYNVYSRRALSSTTPNTNLNPTPPPGNNPLLSSAKVGSTSSGVSTDHPSSSPSPTNTPIVITSPHVASSTSAASPETAGSTTGTVTTISNFDSGTFTRSSGGGAGPLSSSSTPKSSTIQGPPIIPSRTPSSTHTSKLRNGIIIGIVAAILVALAGLLFAVFFIQSYRRKAVEEMKIKPTAFDPLDDKSTSRVNCDNNHPLDVTEQNRAASPDTQQQQELQIAGPIHPVGHTDNPGQILPPSSMQDPHLPPLSLTLRHLTVFQESRTPQSRTSTHILLTDVL